MPATDQFLSCDWGTSAFRLRLIQTSTLHTLAEETSKQGIAATFDLWKENGQDEKDRLGFYIAILKEALKKLQQKWKATLEGIPLVISGMASSSIGMIELPYKGLPFAMDGTDLQTQMIEADDQFPHKIIIVSGAKTDNDVMRGEETKLVGCTITNKETTILLPGTHPKHATVKNGIVTHFKTYMTGEFFNLLSQKSILAVSVEEAGFEQPAHQKSFIQGVRDSLNLNLLHSCFLVRTNQLFNKFTKAENYHYLSGLLIGTELKDLKEQASDAITLVSNERMKPLYEMALKVLRSGTYSD